MGCATQQPLAKNIACNAAILRHGAVDTRVTIASTPLLDSAVQVIAIKELTQLLEELDFIEDQNFHLSQITIEAVSKLSGLTKLSLRFSSFHMPTDLDPLSCLTKLTHLHLVHMTQRVCCKGVLHSSRLTLQHVHLAAPVLTCASFGGLYKIAQLDTVRIAIRLATLTQRQLALFDSLKCNVKEIIELSQVPPRWPCFISSHGV